MSKKSLMPVDESYPAIEYGGPIEPIQQLYAMTPYVQFLSQKSGRFSEVAQRVGDLADGDPILFVDGDPKKLNPLRFFECYAFQHFSVLDGEGKIIRTTLDHDTAKQSRDWVEHVESVLIVIDGDTLTPARCTFKSLKCPAIHAALKALADASDVEEWAKRSVEHKQTLAVPHAWARFTTTAKITRKTSKNGFKCVIASGFVRPSAPVEWKMLADAFKDETFKRTASEVLDQHRKRVAETKAKAV